MVHPLAARRLKSTPKELVHSMNDSMNEFRDTEYTYITWDLLRMSWCVRHKPGDWFGRSQRMVIPKNWCIIWP